MCRVRLAGVDQDYMTDLNSGQDGAFTPIKRTTPNRFKVIEDMVEDNWMGLFWL